MARQPIWYGERRKAIPTLFLSRLLGWNVLRSLRVQQRARAELSAEKEKFQVLTENTDDVIWATDPEGVLTYISPSVQRQRGFTPEECLAMDREAFYARPEDVATFRECFATARATPPCGQPFAGRTFEAFHPRKDGSRVPSEVQLNLIGDEAGRLLGLRGLTRDISVRKRLEAERNELIMSLQMALDEVETLEGLLPICSQCKKIRDESGQWSPRETYISKHSDATFTHGICPDCAQAFRADIRQKRQGGSGEKAG